MLEGLLNQEESAKKESSVELVLRSLGIANEELHKVISLRIINVSFVLTNGIIR